MIGDPQYWRQEIERAASDLIASSA